jgi:hypothetical protein
MRVALIGPPQSGKTTLFAAVAAAGGSQVDLSRPDQPHLAVVKVPDPRLDWLTELYQPKKTTPAELECIDLPGMDLTDEAGRTRARSFWPEIRNADMLAFVVRSFEDPSVAAYRDRIDPAGDIEEFLSEMLFADLEQVANRIEKLEVAVTKPTGRREEQKKELELFGKLREALESEQRLAEVATSESQQKILRSFAFFSQKPAIAVVNCAEDQLDQEHPTQLASLPAVTLSARIEEEIAQLPAEERQEFLADLGLEISARDRLIQACYQRMNLVSFLTVGEDECRAWTIPAGTDAVTAAEEIHSDIARGFIRAETVAFEDLKEAGQMKLAKSAGTVRLEGKHYVVQDGDIINFRFNV